MEKTKTMEQSIDQRLHAWIAYTLYTAAAWADPNPDKIDKRYYRKDSCAAAVFTDFLRAQAYRETLAVACPELEPRVEGATVRVKRFDDAEDQTRIKNLIRRRFTVDQNGDVIWRKK
jgi:hypothetical protein